MSRIKKRKQLVKPRKPTQSRTPTRRRPPVKSRPPAKARVGTSIKFVTVTRYRSPKTGRFTKRKRKEWGETIEYLITPRKKIPIKVTRTSKRKVIRTLTQVDLDSAQGLIGESLLNTNIATQLKGAIFVSMKIRGRGPDGKIKSWVKDVQAGKPKTGKEQTKLFNAIVYAIKESLDDRGLRTQYNLKEVSWRGLKTKRKESAARSEFKDMSVIIEVDR